MAIQYGHVNPVFPYVSDAGGLVPQASFFSQLLDVISFFSKYFLILIFFVANP